MGSGMEDRWDTSHCHHHFKEVPKKKKPTRIVKKYTIPVPDGKTCGMVLVPKSWLGKKVLVTLAVED
jgi:putative transposon-encoded protein